MSTRVIQGYFIGGRADPTRLATRPAPVQRVAAPVVPRSGPPGPAFAGRSSPVAQPHGATGSFAIDPVQLGLARSGGSPLPTPLLAKMEAAFGADFSAVRVHVGPQAARIGAIAFTTGNDLYFAPGRYQPDSVQGQQLIGHELAHVIQQRQGRVRAPGSGVSVVQDHALEAEADRLGMRAAMHRPQQTPATSLVQRKALGGNDTGRPSQPGRPSLANGVRPNAAAPMLQGRGIQRSVDLESYGGGQSKKFFALRPNWKNKVKKKSSTKIVKMFSDQQGISSARSYDKQRIRQMLRWISSLLFKNYPTCVEIQCYFEDGVIYVSSNVTTVNNKIREDIGNNFFSLLHKAHQANFPTKMDEDFRQRINDHGRKLFSDQYYPEQEELLGALEISSFIVPHEDYDVDLHAERRIQEYLGKKLDPNLLGGVKRACTVCAIDLGFTKSGTVGPFWPSKSALGGYDAEDIKKTIKHDKVFSQVTRSKRMTKKEKLTTDYDSDSDSDADDY